MRRHTRQARPAVQPPASSMRAGAVSPRRAAGNSSLGEVPPTRWAHTEGDPAQAPGQREECSWSPRRPQAAQALLLSHHWAFRRRLRFQRHPVPWPLQSTSPLRCPCRPPCRSPALQLQADGCHRARPFERPRKKSKGHSFDEDRRRHESIPRLRYPGQCLLQSQIQAPALVARRLPALPAAERHWDQRRSPSLGPVSTGIPLPAWHCGQPPRKAPHQACPQMQRQSPKQPGARQSAPVSSQWAQPPNLHPPGRSMCHLEQKPPSCVFLRSGWWDEGLHL